MNNISWLSVFFYIALLVRLILAGVYLYSAFGKFRYLNYFVKIVARYKLLPAFLVKPFAYFLPWLE